MRNSIEMINEEYEGTLEKKLDEGRELDLDDIFDRTFYFIYR